MELTLTSNDNACKQDNNVLLYINSVVHIICYLLKAHLNIPKRRAVLSNCEGDYFGNNVI